MSGDNLRAAAERDEGLLSKYHVERRNDPGGKHDECRYFVLDPQHDPIARDALRAYATAAGAEGYFALRSDLHHWLDQIEVEHPAPDRAKCGCLHPKVAGCDHDDAPEPPSEGQVVLGQVGEHVEPQACRECGKSASACGRSRNFCCAACSRSRFGTHDPAPSSGATADEIYDVLHQSWLASPEFLPDHRAAADAILARFHVNPRVES